MKHKKPFIKYPEIPYLEANLGILDNSIYAFEKLDGGNCQVRNISGRLVGGSRSNFLQGKSLTRFKWFQDFNKWIRSTPELYSLDPNFVLFGEWLSFHNIRYDPEHENQFYFIDMYDIEEGRYVAWPEALENLAMMGINTKTPRILAEGKISQRRLDNLLLKRKSDYRTGIREGLVLKDYENQQFAKYLHPKFSEVAEDNRLPTVERYVTKKRIEKTVRALLEEGKVITKASITSKIQGELERNHKQKLSRKQILRRVKELKTNNP